MMTGAIGSARNRDRLGLMGSIGYQEKLWNSVPCTVDELGRVMAHVCDSDVTNTDGSPCSPCPSTWECAPANEIDPAETVQLRFRVMVNRLKRVAFAVFRCTDTRKVADVDLNLHIIDRSWTTEQAQRAAETLASSMFPSTPITDHVLWILRNAPRPVLQEVSRVYSNVGIMPLAVGRDTRPDNPFESVELANTYIRDRVQPWALRNNCTLVVGGYSLGGFIAQYVGFKQGLYNVSFDGLWGVTKFLPEFRDVRHLDRILKCATIFRRRDSIISWPQIQMGCRYQITPDRDIEIQITNGGMMGYLGHNMSLFYDKLNPPQYSAQLSRDDISAMYASVAYGGNPSGQEVTDLFYLHRVAECFRRNEIPMAMYLFYGDNPISEVFRNAVYHQMYFIKRDHYRDDPELGRKCFNISSYVPQPYHSSTPQEQFQAIYGVLTNRWRQARGL